MTNTAVGKALLLSFSLALVVAGGLASCSGTSEVAGGAASNKVGGIGLNLVVSPGPKVSVVNYTITGNGYSKSGTIDVSGGGSVFTTTVNGIPAGTGYEIDLTATADDGSTGTGSAKFDVVARQVTTVKVVLRFIPKTPTTGSVLVDGSINVCPLVASISSQPPSVAVGATAAITSDASDSDSQPSPLTYTWSVSPAGIGTFSSTSVANPTFTATQSGTATLTLLVSDGDDPCQTAPNSLNSLSIQLLVTGSGGAAGSPPAGSGGAGAGGAGAGGAGTGGAGAGGAGAGGAGTGGAGAGGAGAGGAGTGGAGAGGAGAGGAGVGGAGAGGAGAGGAGSGGTVAAGSGGNGGSGATGGGSNACSTCETTAHVNASDGSNNTSCPDSHAAGLALAGNSPVLAGITESTGQAKSVVFQQILDCFHSNHCAKTADTDCFCGAGVDPNTCFSTGTFATATGPCKDLVAIGAESTAIGDINNRFFDPTFAIGAATAVIETCDQFSCVAECL